MVDPSRKRILWIEVGVVLSWVFVPHFAAQFTPQTRIVAGDRAASSLIYQSTTWAAEAAIMVFLMWQSGDGFERFGLKRESPLKGAGIAALLLILNLGIFAVFHHSLPSPSVDRSIAHRGVVGTFLLIPLELTSGFWQELVFRGYLITRFQELFGEDAWAILVSFLLFGLLHIYEGWIGFVGATVFGLIASILFLRTRSVIPLAAAHAIYNLLLYLSY